jgi:hypothetical protein
MKELHLRHVGPAPQFDIEFAPRLNIFTGDNGLGKTFLLDVTWWALTGIWVGSPARPQHDTSELAEIVWAAGWQGVRRANTSRFDLTRQTWPRPKEEPATPALVVYAQVDGGFSVWDTARNRAGGGISFPIKFPLTFAPGQPVPYLFTSESLWNGLESQGRTLCNGLIRDWITWQYQPDPDNGPQFRALKDVLKVLSPPHELLKPGRPTRVSVDDVRDIPTVELPYDTIPVTLLSAGMKRILGLAYLLVWTWYEHVHASTLLKQAPARHLVLLIDEAEAHLHPAWQRTLVPAALGVAAELDKHIKTQLIMTTHSPLVLASVEPGFDETHDRLFLFEMKGREITLRQMPWAKQGDAVGWLTSDVFGLKQARSREAEVAIEAAEAYMRQDTAALPSHLQTREQIQKELERVLAGHDPFWPRWIVETRGEPA